MAENVLVPTTRSARRYPRKAHRRLAAFRPRENRELKATSWTPPPTASSCSTVPAAISPPIRSAEALFGYEFRDFTEHSFGDLSAPESRTLAIEYLDRLAHSSGAGVLDAGLQAIGRVRQGGRVPLHITMGRIEGARELCVVLRDVTAWKHTAEELTRQAGAEKASIAKSEFSAKISHESANRALLSSSAFPKS